MPGVRARRRIGFRPPANDRLRCRMPCDECRPLVSHAFRTPDDLIHALRLAAEEVNRGVLERDDGVLLRESEREAVESSLASGALPNRVNYQFRCALCGDRFTLEADPQTGEDEMGQAEAAALANAPMSPNDPRTWGKISRNEPCPCGSGKKFKHCHGALV